MKKGWFKKLKVILSTCYKILFRKYDHWAVISIDDENLELLLKDKNFDANITHHGTQHYVTLRMIQRVSEAITWEGITLEKAKFQYEAEEHQKDSAQ